MNLYSLILICLTGQLAFAEQDTSDVDNKTSLIDFIETKAPINKFNRHILPLLKSLMVNDYFRYVRLNLNRPCKLWCNAEKCNLKDCKVKEVGDLSKCPTAIFDDQLSSVVTRLINNEYDISECYEHDDQDSRYIDLIVNPESYTGYSGESANRVWRAIYDENCFIRQLTLPFEDRTCYERRLFYEAISGLHSSINIHLCAEYPSNSLIGDFEPNLDEFLRRFDGHNDYINNLYTLYLLELRALMSSKQYFLKKVIWPDNDLKAAIQNLFSVMEKLDVPILDDTNLKPNYISKDLAVHFQNITTTIMDCVACDKCKLWGKVQLRGLGAAFKILSTNDISRLNLNHQEIVSLFNAISRLSHSIRYLETFRDLITKTTKLRNEL